MANLTIKDLPDDVHAAMKRAARDQGRSLNGYIIEVLTEDAHERARRRRMQESQTGLRRLVASLPRLSDSTALIREDRDRKH